MRAVIQRVKSASVAVADDTIGRIDKGLLVFLAVAKEDQEEDADYLVNKIAHLRVFEDVDGKMNLSALQTSAEILLISQFTLYGDCRKGRRPSFDKAASPAEGETLYQYFVSQISALGLKVETGRFQAMMDVSLVNDGPVTLIIESL